MKKVDIRTAIYDAIDETDESMEKYMIQLLKWAMYIEREIGTFYGYPIKSEKQTISGCEYTLPSDCYRPLVILPGDYTDECNAYYKSKSPFVLKEDIREDESTLIWVPMHSSVVYPRYWTMTGNKLHLIQKYDEQVLTLLYQYIETTADGFWIVNESHVDAITKFLKYKMSMKFNWKLMKSSKLLRQGHLQMSDDLKDDYNSAVRHARALDEPESPYDSQYKANPLS